MWGNEKVLEKMDRGDGYTVVMSLMPLTCTLERDRSSKCHVNSTTRKREIQGVLPKISQKLRICILFIYLKTKLQRMVLDSSCGPL